MFSHVHSIRDPVNCFDQFVYFYVCVYIEV